MNPLEEKAAWHRANASPKERLAIAAHELGHYEMAKRAGVDPEGITIGHHPRDRRSGSVLFGGDIDTGLTHSLDQWQRESESIPPSERRMFILSYVKYQYAGEIAEELVTGTGNNSGVVDSEVARRWMMKLGMSQDAMNRKEAELKQRVREELSEPTTKCKLVHAAQQLAEHHFDGQKHLSTTIDHYLNGGTYQDFQEGGKNGQHQQR